MKKFVTLLCCLTICFSFLFAPPVFAENTDTLNEDVKTLLSTGMTVEGIASFIHKSRPFSIYNPDTLMVMYLAIGLELQEQGVQVDGTSPICLTNTQQQAFTVPVGTYVVGKDIQAGDYTVTYTGRIQSVLYIYPNAQAVGGIYSDFHHLSPIMENTSIGRLSLTDGQVIKIEYGALDFSPYKGLDF